MQNSAQDAIAYLLSAVLDLRAGYPESELGEPLAVTVQRALRELPQQSWGDFDLPEDLGIELTALSRRSAADNVDRPLSDDAKQQIRDLDSGDEQADGWGFEAGLPPAELDALNEKLISLLESSATRSEASVRMANYLASISDEVGVLSNVDSLVERYGELLPP